MDIKEFTSKSSRDTIEKALIYFLENYTSPAFGVLPKTEIDLLVLETLMKIGCISDTPESYELISKLKVTNTKARTLLYNRDLRKSSESDLDEKVKLLLKKPVIEKSHEKIILEIENTLVADHLKYRIRKLGFISDGSFSPTVVKLRLNAFAALIADYLEEEEKRRVENQLRKAGAQGSTFKELLTSTVTALAKKTGSMSSEAAIQKAQEVLSPILEGTASSIYQSVESIF